MLRVLGEEGHDLLKCERKISGAGAWPDGQDLLGRVLMCIEGYVRFGEEGNE